MTSDLPIRVSDHGISRENLDKNALDVINQLNEHGYDAYLVGGCVRDLLCGMTPKDFDVATNAKPEEVREIFRRSRLVGRRFPIAHVRYGRDIIEVSTFRQVEHDQIETSDSGLIVKDHAFGDMADDAFRRDFTVNALYFDVQNAEIIDYVGGIEDVENRRLRFIGDPVDRLAEDPVRLLRAMRFAAKLDFEIDPVIFDHEDDVADYLEAIPGARLFDEFLKLFLTGHAAPVWEQLRDTPLVRSLFPTCNPESELVLAAMRNTDERIANDQPVTPGFLIAVLLWDDFQTRVAEQNPDNKPGPMFELAMDTFAVQQQHLSMPRRFTMFAREVWSLQDRLETRQQRNITRLLHHKRFRAAFDFLVLRGREDKKLKEIGQWWEDIQTKDQAGQKKMIDALPQGKGGNRRRRRKRRRSNNRSNPNAQPAQGYESAQFPSDSVTMHNGYDEYR